LSVRRFVAILCASLAVATALRFAAHPHEQKLDKSRVLPRANPLDPAKLPRKIYPYSVIPGGAYSGEELALARRVDRVVAFHYSDFETGAVTVRTLPREAYLYVSYRKADRVYWTANKRRIPKGETVLSDGKNLARTRCGNRLSETPQLPIAAGPQPTETALNGPEIPASVELPQAPLFGPLYDAPVMPLVNARERVFAFPGGVTGASPVGEAFPAFGPHSPMIAVANLPFVGPGAPSTTTGGPTGPSSSPTPVGSGPGGSGHTPGPPGRGPIPRPVPEPATAVLLSAGAAVLMLQHRRVRHGRSVAD
jgi:hypothetical protein